jgi:hypothetical protein
MVYVTIDGLPNVLTYSSMIKQLARRDIKQAILSVEGISLTEDQIVVFVRSDLIQWGQGSRVRCVLESELFLSHAGGFQLNQRVTDAVHAVLSRFCQQQLVNNPAADLKGCIVEVETRELDRQLHGYKLQTLT